MRELCLADGALELVVLPKLGGRIHRLRAFGHDLLRTPDNIDRHVVEPLWWGSYPMVPWCNRIPAGLLVFEGQTRQLPAEYDGHAIHGRGFDVPWSDVSATRIELRDAGDETFPWPFFAWQEFTVKDHTVSLTIGVENAGTTPMPAGVGIHPWFNASEPLEVRLPADLIYPSTGNIPEPAPVQVTGPHDLRSLKVAEWNIDEIWTGITEQQIDLRWPMWGIDASYSFSSNVDHVVLATIEKFDAIAIEPQTHATDGHRRLQAGKRGAIRILEPDEQLIVDYQLEIGGDGTRS